MTHSTASTATSQRPAWLISALGLPVTGSLYVAFLWDYFGIYQQWNHIAIPIFVASAFLHYIYFLELGIPALRQKNYTVFSLHIFLSLLCLISFFYFIHITFTTPEEIEKILDLFYQNKGKEILKKRGFITFIRLFSSFLTVLFILTFNGLLANWQLNALNRTWVEKPSLLSKFPAIEPFRIVVWHILGWAFWTYINIFDQIVKGKPIDWSLTLLLVLPSIVFFYISLRTSFRLLARNQLFLAILSALLLWFALCAIKGLWFASLVHFFDFPPVFDGKNILENEKYKAASLNSVGTVGYFVGFVLAAVGNKEAYIILVSFIYGYARRAIRDQRELTKLAEIRQKEALHQQELQKQVVDARLQSLKYQINPHFLFNSLNFLYAQSLPLSEDLSRATLLLSEMMRYALNENSDESKVPLEHEIKHLENFLEFNQLRFSNRLQVNFSTEGNIHFRRIMPLLLITFVENAFKYGELHDAQYPLIINLLVTENALTFFVKNKKRSGPKENSTGIGLDNIRRRLLLGYPERHTLTIDDTEHFFTTELVIVL
ncbi:sensor histidine kinase [Arundinibacter roseus]|uniref:Signal transduction histidine kinase internal region domain-containing protein n=1 Tax=Arundinibacter roseus TaxID=2070510 RepID=A0A4R4KKR3_9BACT|nr:histidine kinase [Arundinibacter roseus]TDB68860.1 hypothetical protein EZE20_00510 [Arundinibacter roseus]